MSKPIYLTEAEHKLVSDAVGAAEDHTSGEIVTIVADRSDGYTDVALIWSAIAAFAAVALYSTFPDFYLEKIDWLLGLWGHDWTHREILGIAVAIVVLKFVGVFLIQLIPAVKYFLIPGKVKTARVHARAQNLFKVGAERRTEGQTGILIYLSMREHRAEIVAEDAIASIVSAETWGEAMADMLEHIKEGRIADGMVAGVRDVGAVLAEHFPRADDDTNELPDRLIEL